MFLDPNNQYIGSGGVTDDDAVTPVSSMDTAEPGTEEGDVSVGQQQNTPVSSSPSVQSAAPEQASKSVQLASDKRAGSRPPRSQKPLSLNLRDGLKGVGNDLRGQAVDGGLNYAANAIKDQQKSGSNSKYSGALDTAGDVVKGLQKHHQENGQINFNDAKKIASQVAFDSAKTKLGNAAKDKIAKKIAEHPELLGDVGKLMNDVSGKKLTLGSNEFYKRTDQAAQNLAKKGLQQAAKSGGSALANEAIPLVGAISATDAVRGVGRGVKQLKDAHVVKAAKEVVTGVAKSVIVTLFRLSYEWYIIGLSWGLSLIVTLILGNLLFLMPNRGMTLLERLLVVALDLLLFFILMFLLMSVVVMNCSGLTLPGLALKAASYFSSTANGFNELCKTFNIFEQASQLSQNRP